MLDFKRLNIADEKYAEYLTDFRDNHKLYLEDLVSILFESNEYLHTVRFSIIDDFEWYKCVNDFMFTGSKELVSSNLDSDFFQEFLERHEHVLCDIYDVGSSAIHFIFKRGKEMEVIYPAERDRSWD